ncbi:hypothetical protein [Microbulbifer sp. SAOS-129_SWC]|uniref:hypothetical protein n=1 Tax=Microbulbifer sp. SAOS-129_SWC TaxID=3145235 RepID=UPI00321654A3
MFKTLTKLIALGLVVVFTGCANVAKMPLGAGNADVSAKSILLAKVHVVNLNKPGHQPDLFSVVLEQNGEQRVFKAPTLVVDNGAGGKEYFVSVQANPGKAVLKVVTFTRSVPLLLNAIAALPLEYAIDVPANQVVYVGNIDAKIKPRADGQPRAGSVIPLIDQAVAGFSTGTFDVQITDNYDQDTAELRSKYPYLAKQDISKLVLPQWTHPDLRDKKNTVIAVNTK